MIMFEFIKKHQKENYLNFHFDAFKFFPIKKENIKLTIEIRPVKLKEIPGYITTKEPRTKPIMV